MTHQELIEIEQAFEIGWEEKIDHQKKTALSCGEPVYELFLHKQEKERFHVLLEAFKPAFREALKNKQFTDCLFLIDGLNREVHAIDRVLFPGTSVEVDALAHWLAILSMGVESLQGT